MSAHYGFWNIYCYYNYTAKRADDNMTYLKELIGPGKKD